MTETEKIEHVHKLTKAAAEYWHGNFKPVTYKSPFFINGDWIRVTIELVSAKDAMPTQPRRRAGDRVDESNERLGYD